MPGMGRYRFSSVPQSDREKGCTYVVVGTAVMLVAAVTFVPLDEHKLVIFLNHPFATVALISVAPTNACGVTPPALFVADGRAVSEVLLV